MSKKVIFFDVNETTLDLAPIGAVIEELCGTNAMQMWFDRLIQMSSTMAHIGSYPGFGPLAASAFGAICEIKGIPVGDKFDKFKAAMATMPAHPDVAPGLSELSARGWKLVAFSNSTKAALTANLQAAGIVEKYDDVISVDLAQTFKPVLACYHEALKSQGVSADDAVMVACHDWDLAGAKAVGMKTAFIKRPNCVFASAYVPPDFVANTFAELPDLLDAAK
eukprot:TRINITY_DN27934_c0_g1_i1.p1 TRINITY_DN27934_c0_g1~~TRINITY_DN27934_c0_g1_i1.p1  ORF type:complete len:222 (+),score=51.69 TRINITY_DN27934_c0_g1_i1:70-735(+)